MLDAAQSAEPKAEHSITLTPENSLLLPIHDTELSRIVGGVDGAYRGHVYRDCMVWHQPVLDHLVIVTPVVAGSPRIRMDRPTLATCGTAPSAPNRRRSANSRMRYSPGRGRARATIEPPTGESRRAGKAGVRPFRARWAQYTTK